MPKIILSVHGWATAGCAEKKSPTRFFLRHIGISTCRISTDILTREYPHQLSSNQNSRIEMSQFTKIPMTRLNVFMSQNFSQRNKRLLNRTHKRNLFEILLNLTEIRLYSPFSDWFATANGRLFAVPYQSENGKYNLSQSSRLLAALIISFISKSRPLLITPNCPSRTQ